jgi:hypothetical protein
VSNVWVGLTTSTDFPHHMEWGGWGIHECDEVIRKLDVFQRHAVPHELAS